MPRNLYVNLPVKDLERTIDFFAALGFSFNPKFTDENATCMIINDGTSVMLLVESFFATFTKKPLADARACT
ncbi:MAG: glyoxalase/bleomycin resistance/extradiol dioxygenase family protein, partial [Lysobacteraceae bacterium]